MEPDPHIPPSKDNPQAGDAPSLSAESEPPVIGASLSLSADSSPPLLPKPDRKSSPGRQMVAVVLSLCLGLFMADAAVSLVDDLLNLFLGIHVLAGIRGIVFLFTLLLVVVTHGLMGLTPLVSKRLFLPVTLFIPVAWLFTIPVFIYFHDRSTQVAWVVSFFQVVVGLGLLYRAQGGFKFRWPLIAEIELEGRRFFDWKNLSVFVLVNVFVLLPSAAVYLVLCAALAVDHFSDGFLALRPDGLTVQMRKYVRNDGKTIRLFPMAHVGEPDFYRRLLQSFPTNSIILTEGVSDDRNLLTNKISYKRMAASLGLAEQQREFKPDRGERVRADVDVGQFTTNTIDFLNLVMLVHAKGVNAETMPMLTQYSAAPHFEQQLFDDILRKRNRRLLEELHFRLSQTDNIVVPWGAAHMPEIAKEIQKSGFRLDETQDYVVIRFRSIGNKMKDAMREKDNGKPE